MRVTTVLLTALLVAASLPARSVPLADVTVVDRSSGERLETYAYQGRRYLAGRPGNRYAIEIRNRSSGRIMAVVSVDGVNAITGETAAPDQSGYVLASGQRNEILGWRKSTDDVAAFYFTRLPDAYAARTGRPDNVGVIGVALFREYVEPPPMAAPAAATGAGETAALRRAEAQQQKLGTGHGERVTSPIRYTEFRRASEAPAEVVTLYYDSYENLVARGIITAPRPPRPNPFPGGFVPDPN